MPEEQAFCVLVKLMYDYGLRNLYRDGFEALYMRLYQLNRLLEVNLHDDTDFFLHYRIIKYIGKYIKFDKCETVFGNLYNE